MSSLQKPKERKDKNNKTIPKGEKLLSSENIKSNQENIDTNSIVTANGNKIEKTQVDRDIDRDIDEIGEGVLRLKGLATELGKEIDNQHVTINKMGDGIQKNTETTKYYYQRVKKI